VALAASGEYVTWSLTTSYLQKKPQLCRCNCKPLEYWVYARTLFCVCFEISATTTLILIKFSISLLPDDMSFQTKVQTSSSRHLPDWTTCWRSCTSSQFLNVKWSYYGYTCWQLTISIFRSIRKLDQFLINSFYASLLPVKVLCAYLLRRRPLRSVKKLTSHDCLLSVSFLCVGFQCICLSNR